MNKLAVLCRPLLVDLCETCYYAQQGAQIDSSELRQKLQYQLSQLKTQSENDPSLKRDFAKIEQSLVFFIDYTIKEGKLPFSREWIELARNYNELSGDEKFFDLLTETLDDPDVSDRLQVYFLMLGLGFDGCYRNNPEYVERRMKLCASRFSGPTTGDETVWFTPAAQDKKKKRHIHASTLLLIFSVLFAIVAFLFNYQIFLKHTAEFRTVLATALDNSRSSWGKSASTIDGKEKIIIPVSAVPGTQTDDAESAATRTPEEPAPQADRTETDITRDSEYTDHNQSTTGGLLYE